MRYLTLALAALGSTFLNIAPAKSQDRSEAAPMQKVEGIGGFFFRAQDPKALAQWYADNLGIDLTPTSYDVEPWTQQEGPTVFAPFKANNSYFGNPNKQWMINFRVADLDAMVEQLRANGVDVEYEGDEWPNGRFARLVDPEGNPIQLWEPQDNR